MNTRLFLAGALTLILTVLSVQPALAANCSKSIPAPLRSQLKTDWPDWRLLEVGDLIADHQKIWTQDRRGCPSVARANFDGTGRRQYFLLIVHKKQDAVRMVFYIARKGGKFKLGAGAEDHEVTESRPVISVGPPGKYETRLMEGSVGPTIKVRHPVVVWQLLESYAAITYFERGEMRDAIIAD